MHNHSIKLVEYFRFWFQDPWSKPRKEWIRSEENIEGEQWIIKHWYRHHLSDGYFQCIIDVTEHMVYIYKMRTKNFWAIIDPIHIERYSTIFTGSDKMECVLFVLKADHTLGSGPEQCSEYCKYLLNFSFFINYPQNSYHRTSVEHIEIFPQQALIIDSMLHIKKSLKSSEEIFFGDLINQWRKALKNLLDHYQSIKIFKIGLIVSKKNEKWLFVDVGRRSTDNNRFTVCILFEKKYS